MNISASLENIATFARGAFYATDNPAFNCIYEDLNTLVAAISKTQHKEVSIIDLDIGITACDALIADGIASIDKLLECSIQRLRQVPNLGLASLTNIIKEINRRGLKLKESS